MFLTQNFLKIPNLSFVFIYDMQNYQTLQVKNLTSYFCAIYLPIAIKKAKNIYLRYNVACTLGCIKCPNVFKTFSFLFYFVPLIAG